MNVNGILKYAKNMTYEINTSMKKSNNIDDGLSFLHNNIEDLLKIAYDDEFIANNPERVESLRDTAIPSIINIGDPTSIKKRYYKDGNAITDPNVITVLAMRNNLYAIYTSVNWLYSKQIFCFDDILLNDLLSNVNPDFANIKHYVSYLPFNTFVFYVESIHQGDDILIRASYVQVGIVNDGGHIDISMLFIDANGNLLNAVCADPCEDNCTTYPFFKIIMQLIMYISSPKSDVVQSSSTKNTYKPNKTVKNQYKEICAWDVGYRYAKSVKSNNTHTTRTQSSNNESKSNSTRTGTGASKKPHVRKGHWHHYWVGKRNSPNRRLILKWINQCDINMDFTSELPLIIHKESKDAKEEDSME